MGKKEEEISPDKDITDYIVQDRMSGEFSTDILHRKVFNVNIRLMGTSPGYFKIVMETIQYMRDVLRQDYSNYSTVRGISGANVGIPFNIIGIRLRAKPKPPGFLLIDGFNGTTFMINPQIVERSEATRECTSNCGSVRLKSSIKVLRNKWVRVEYYNMNLIKETHKFEGFLGYTIQHEVEHNQGVLVTDKITTQEVVNNA